MNLKPFVTKLRATVTSITPTRSVDSIVAGVQRDIRRLRAASAAHCTAANTIDKAVDALIERRNQHDAESDRALKVANKLSRLID